MQRYRIANLEKLRKTLRDWQKANPGRCRFLGAKRYIAKLNATPPWVDWDQIAAVYDKAVAMTRDTGIQHEVDHIYPLQGTTCCGLHVPWNLQVITKAENVRKGNRMPC